MTECFDGGNDGFVGERGDGSKMDAPTRVSSEADAERGREGEGTNPLMGIEPQDGVHQLELGSEIKDHCLQEPPCVEPPECWGVSQGESAGRTGLEFKLPPGPQWCESFREQGAYSAHLGKQTGGETVNNF